MIKKCRRHFLKSDAYTPIKIKLWLLFKISSNVSFALVGINGVNFLQSALELPPVKSTVKDFVNALHGFSAVGAKSLVEDFSGANMLSKFSAEESEHRFPTGIDFQNVIALRIAKFPDTINVEFNVEFAPALCSASII